MYLKNIYKKVVGFKQEEWRSVRLINPTLGLDGFGTGRAGVRFASELPGGWCTRIANLTTSGTGSSGGRNSS